MVKIQLDLSDILNKKVRLFALENDHNNKETAIISILEEKLEKR